MFKVIVIEKYYTNFGGISNSNSNILRYIVIDLMSSHGYLTSFLLML